MPELRGPDPKTVQQEEEGMAPTPGLAEEGMAPTCPLHIHGTHPRAGTCPLHIPLRLSRRLGPGLGVLHAAGVGMVAVNQAAIVGVEGRIRRPRGDILRSWLHGIGPTGHQHERM